MAIKRRRLMVAGLAIVAIWLALVLFNRFGTSPAIGGQQAGRLGDCPTSPNCVCSQASREEQQVAPIPFVGSGVQALDAVKEVIDQSWDMQLVKLEDNYIHAISTTLLMRFVDDVEFYVDEDEQLIHVRSASRLGHSDLGANARRVAKLRQRIDEKLQKSAN